MSIAVLRANARMSHVRAMIWDRKNSLGNQGLAARKYDVRSLLFHERLGFSGIWTGDI